MRVPRAQLVTVAAVAVGYVVALAARTDPLVPGHADWLRPWDHQKYQAMAEHPFELRVAPFSWRVLEPLVVHLSPLGTAVSFWLLAVAAVSATIVAVHVLLVHLGFRPLLAWAGTLAFCSLGWVTGYPLYNIWLPDALAGLAVVLVATAAVDRRPARFALLLVLGVLVKEQALLAAPLWYSFGLVGPAPGAAGGAARGAGVVTRARALLDLRLLARTAALVAPALLAVAAVRTALPAGNGDPQVLADLGLAANGWDSLPQDPRVLLATFGRPRLPYLALGIVQWSVAAFGAVGLLGLAAPLVNARALVRWSPFLLGVYVQPLLASNTTRLVAIAFPVAVIVAVQGLDRLQQRLGLHDVTVVAVPLALVVADLLSPTNVRLGAELPMVAAILAVGAPRPPLGALVAQARASVASCRALRPGATGHDRPSSPALAPVLAPMPG